MGLQEIIKRVGVYAIPVLVIVLLAAAIFALLFHILKKKRGGRPFPIRVPITAVMLAGFFTVVVGLTGLSRGSSYTGEVNLNLFSSYLEAWHAYSLISFQLIVFNILMFIPLGILLPMLYHRFKSWRWTVPAVFFSTLMIEVIQLVTGRGIFELDDLFHNTLGGIIGFHLYLLAVKVITKKQVVWRDARYLALPLVLVIIYGCVQAVYHTKEFGNMKINPSSGTDLSDVEVTAVIPLEAKGGTAPVYRNRYANNLNHGREVARLLEQELDLPELVEEVRDGENRQFVYGQGEEGSYYLTYIIRDATWMFHYGGPEMPANDDKDQERRREESEAILKRLSLLPEEAGTVHDTGEELQWRIDREDYPSADMKDGLIMLGLREDGQVNSITNSLTENEYIKEVNLISPRQAFEQLKQGKFDQSWPFEVGDRLTITDLEIEYIFDSKGYYQPVYRFSGEVNGEQGWSVMLAAIR